MYLTSVFLKLGESIYVAIDLSPILLGSLPLAHNAQHSLVIIILMKSTKVQNPRCKCSAVVETNYCLLAEYRISDRIGPRTVSGRVQ